MNEISNTCVITHLSSVHKTSDGVFLVASEPFSDGFSVDTKGPPWRGFDGMAQGKADHLVAQECGIFIFSYDIVDGDRTTLLGHLLEHVLCALRGCHQRRICQRYYYDWPRFHGSEVRFG